MMKKLLIWLMVIMLCLSVVPSFAEEDVLPDEDQVETPSEEPSEEPEEEPEEEEEEEPTLEDKAIYYEIDSDEVLKLRAAAIEKKCLAETGKNLSYITISDVSSGALWYDYDGSKEDKVNTSLKTPVKYYKKGSSYKLIDDITYVPKATFEGEVKITYKGYADKNTYFEGMIIIVN